MAYDKRDFTWLTTKSEFLAKESKAENYRPWQDNIPSLAQISKNISLQQVKTLSKLLPGLQELGSALLDIIYEFNEDQEISPENAATITQFQCFLQKFLRNTGCLTPSTGKVPLETKLLRLQNALESLIQTVPQHSEFKESIQGVFNIERDVFNHLFPLLTSIKALLGAKNKHQQDDIRAHGLKLIISLIDINIQNPGQECNIFQGDHNGQLLSFFGLFEKFYTYNEMLASSIDVAIYSRKIMLLQQSFPHIKQLYGQGACLYTQRDQIIQLFSSGESWPPESLLAWRLDLYRMLTQLFEDPQIRPMLHNVIRHLSVELAKKMGNDAGRALASSIGAVMTPVMSVLRMAQCIDAPSALRKSLFEILRFTASTADASGKTKASLQLLEILFSGLSFSSWLEVLASGPALVQVVSAECSAAQVDELLKDQDRFYHLLNHILLGSLFERKELDQFPNQNPLESLDPVGFLGSINGDVDFDSNPSLVLGAIQMLRPNFYGDLLDGLLSQLTAALGLPPLHRYKEYNPSGIRTTLATGINWVTNLTEIKLELPPVDRQAQEALQLEWENKESDARANKKAFLERYEELKNEITTTKPLPPYTPESLDQFFYDFYSQIKAFDDQIKDAEIACMDCYQARLIFNNKNEGSLRQKLIDSLCADLITSVSKPMLGAIQWEIRLCLEHFSQLPLDVKIKGFPLEANYVRTIASQFLNNLNPKNDPRKPLIAGYEQSLDLSSVEAQLRVLEKQFQNDLSNIISHAQYQIFEIKYQQLNTELAMAIAEFNASTTNADQQKIELFKSRCNELLEEISQSALIKEISQHELTRLKQRLQGQLDELRDVRRNLRIRIVMQAIQKVLQEFENAMEQFANNPDNNSSYESLKSEIIHLKTDAEFNKFFSELGLNEEISYPWYDVLSFYPSYEFNQQKIFFREQLSNLESRLIEFQLNHERKEPISIAAEEIPVIELPNNLHEEISPVVSPDSVLEEKLEIKAEPSIPEQPMINLVAVSEEITAASIQKQLERLNKPNRLTSKMDKAIHAIYRQGSLELEKLKKRNDPNQVQQQLLFLHTSIQLSIELDLAIQELKNKESQTPLEQRKTSASQAITHLNQHIETQAVGCKMADISKQLLGAMLFLLGVAVIAVNALAVSCTVGVSSLALYAGGSLFAASGTLLFFNACRENLPGSLSNLGKTSTTEVMMIK